MEAPQNEKWQHSFKLPDCAASADQRERGVGWGRRKRRGQRSLGKRTVTRSESRKDTGDSRGELQVTWADQLLLARLGLELWCFHWVLTAIILLLCSTKVMREMVLYQIVCLMTEDLHATEWKHLLIAKVYKCVCNFVKTCNKRQLQN